MEVLDNIPVKLDLEQVLKHLHLSKESKHVKKVQELIELVHRIAKPKVLYEVSYVDNKNEDSLYIGGIKFTSSVLRVNLDDVERVFPYVATSGTELDEIIAPSEDLFKDLFLDAMKLIILRITTTYLEDHLTRTYALGQLSKMNPGSLQNWPITQQNELFSIFRNVEDLIGVRLTENFLMIPLKSVSGIYFPTQIKFESCQLCPRDRCSGRRAPYNPDLKKTVYGIS